MAIPPYMQNKIAEYQQGQLQGIQKPDESKQDNLFTHHENLYDVNRERAKQRVYSFALLDDVNKKLRIRVGGDGKIYTVSLLSNDGTSAESDTVDQHNLWVKSDGSDSLNRLSELSEQQLSNTLNNVKHVKKQDNNSLILILKI